MLENEKEIIIKSLSCIHASEGTIEEVYKMAEKKQSGSIFRKRIIIVAASVFMAIALSATVFAASMGIFSSDADITASEFFNQAFGNSDAGREAYDVAFSDSDGNTVKTEHYPAIERTELDAEIADLLIGADVLEINQGITSGNYSLIVRYLVIDENGIGAVMYEVVNPDGIRFDSCGNITDDRVGKNPVRLGLSTDSGSTIDILEYLSEAYTTETKAVYVSYFTPFTAYKGEDIVLNFYCKENRKISTVSEKVPIESTVSAKTFTDKGISANVSPLGMKLNIVGDISVNRMVIYYTDGTEYTVLGNDYYNCTVSSLAAEFSAYSFNRLVDVEKIVKIDISGRLPDESSFEYCLR